MRVFNGAMMMKMILAGLISLSLAAPAVWAKGRGPRVTRVTPARIKKDLGGKGVIKVDVRRKGAGATYYPSDGRTLWEQTVEIHSRTKFKGVRRVYRGDVVYIWTGRGWKYSKVRPAGVSYTGLKNPSAKEFAAALAIAGNESVLNTITLRYATKIHSVKFAKKPKFNWANPTSVSFLATVVYDVKDGNDLAKVEQDFHVGMVRESFKGGFAAYCKKDPTCISGGNPGQRKIISKTTVGSKRIKEMKSLYTAARLRYIEPKYAALGAPDEWKDLMQFARYAYKALYSGDEKTWEAFIYYHGDNWDEYDAPKKLMIDNKDAFRAQFCPELVITKKSGRKGDDEFFFFSDKGGKSNCHINVKVFNGYRVNRVRCEFAVGDEAKAIAAIPPEKGCVENLAPDKVYNKLGLKKGDKVMSKWHGTGKEYPGQVSQLKEKTVWIKYEDGMSEEVPYDGIRFRDGHVAAKAQPASKAEEKKDAQPETPAAPHPSGLKVGDKIMSKWHGTGREYPGKVGKLEAERVYVLYKDGDKEWVPIKAVRKR